MYWLILKKELKYFFSNIGNLIFVFVLPFLIILLMSTALKDYVATDFDTFKDGVVFYYNDNATEKSQEYLKKFKQLLKESTNVELKEFKDFKEGKEKVNKSEAYGIINVNGDKFSYYRSPYNEPEGGKLVRGIFEEAMGRDVPSDKSLIRTHVIERPRVNSNDHFTFAELPFIMMYIALMIGHSVIDERRFGTIERIKISKMGIGVMLMSKVTLGICIGILQIVTVYILSNVFLGVSWGSMTGYMVLVLLGIALLSSTFGAVIGMIAKTKVVSDNIILMTAIMAGYFGGALSPLYLMENMKFVRHIIKISPLYWSGRALGSLRVGILDNNTFTCWGVCITLTVVFYGVYKMLSKKSKLVI